MIRTTLLAFTALLIIFSAHAYPCNITAPLINNDEDHYQLTAYYDLRQRNSYIQVTNINQVPTTIHVQIFQHDRGCTELDFYDDLTANDTVVYDMDNIAKNDGSPAPITLLDDSYGYVVITSVLISDNDMTDEQASLIGNFRIIDDADYEYRTNMNGISSTSTLNPFSGFMANFNTIDDANQADVIGYAYLAGDNGGLLSANVTNHAPGFDFDIFVYDLSEEPLSCDRRNFACGNVMNYGVNEDYPASRGNNLLCPGGGLADNMGGYINFTNIGPNNELISENILYFGLIGINNNNGTGSMDTWIKFDPPVAQTDG